MYDYIIYGAGPTGLTLALELSKKGKVALIEKQSKIGGCWRVDWLDNKYFSEHSPKITTKDHKGFYKLMKSIDLDFDQETKQVYSNSFITTMQIFQFIISGLTIIDIIKLLIFYFLYSIQYINDINLSKWMENTNISENGKKTLSKLSVLLADIPEKTMITDFLGSFSTDTMLQLKNPEKWLDLIHKKLIHNKVDILLNTQVEKLTLLNGNIYNGVIFGKKHLFTLPPLAFYNLLRNSEHSIKFNWGNILPLLKNSYYSSIGFQLHFDTDISIPKKFCWFCKTNGICLKHSINNSYSVLSCTIIDQRNIKNLNDTIDVVVKQLISIIKTKPFKITINNDINKNNLDNKYIKYNSNDTSFVRTEHGIINPKGLSNDLFTIGSHNKNGITTINKSIRCAYDFIHSYML